MPSTTAVRIWVSHSIAAVLETEYWPVTGIMPGSTFAPAERSMNGPTMSAGILSRSEDGDVWIDMTPRLTPRQHHLERLPVGFERDIPLIIGKAILPLLENDSQAVEPFRIGLEFGTRYRRAGWGQGLTIHTCLQNLLPWLDEDDRPRAVFHGLSAVANDCDGEPPRFAVRPLPMASVDVVKLKAWFRQFIEVRNAEGAERCIASAVRAGTNIDSWPTSFLRLWPNTNPLTSDIHSISPTRRWKRWTLLVGITRSRF